MPSTTSMPAAPRSLIALKITRGLALPVRLRIAIAEIQGAQWRRDEGIDTWELWQPAQKSYERDQLLFSRTDEDRMSPLFALKGYGEAMPRYARSLDTMLPFMAEANLSLHPTEDGAQPGWTVVCESRSPTTPEESPPLARRNTDPAVAVALAYLEWRNVDLKPLVDD